MFRTAFYSNRRKFIITLQNNFLIQYAGVFQNEPMYDERRRPFQAVIIFELIFKSIMNRATDLKKQSSGNEKPKKVDEEERFKCFMEVEGEQKFAQYAFWCFPITAHFGNISLSF